MAAIKFVMWCTAILSALAAVLLLWNESSATCGMLFCKLYETMFIALAVVATREAAKIKVE